MFNLIVVELAEVLHIYLCFLSIYYSCKSVKFYIVKFEIFYSLNYVAELAYSRRLDKNSVGMKLVQHLFQCLPKVSYEAAANAA